MYMYMYVATKAAWWLSTYHIYVHIYMYSVHITQYMYMYVNSNT